MLLFLIPLFCQSHFQNSYSESININNRSVRFNIKEEGERKKLNPIISQRENGFEIKIEGLRSEKGLKIENYKISYEGDEKMVIGFTFENLKFKEPELKYDDDGNICIIYALAN